MKRGGNLQRTGLRRKTEMPRGNGLRSGSGLKRAEWKRPAASNASGARVGTRPRRSSATSKDTIPPEVRRQVNARDPWCVRCGSPRDLHCHHRRLKQDGGDTRAHTECPCNITRFCLECHLVEIHGGDRREAEAHGYIIPAETLLPGSVSVAVATADGGLTLYPDCDGEWSTAPPGERAA